MGGCPLQQFFLSKRLWWRAKLFCRFLISYRQYLNINTNPSWQVKTFTDTFLNIISNFIPSETKRFVPRDPPLDNETIENNECSIGKMDFSITTKNIVIKLRIKLGLEAFHTECQQAVETSNLSYLMNLGSMANILLPSFFSCNTFAILLILFCGRDCVIQYRHNTYSPALC